jgi:hypothetical protein
MPAVLETVLPSDLCNNLILNWTRIDLPKNGQGSKTLRSLKDFACRITVRKHYGRLLAGTGLEQS